MKTGIYRALFCLVLAASLFLAPSANAMVMVKNYTRYTGAYVAPLEYVKGNTTALDSDDSEKGDERPRYTGWKSILNIFR
ncbi:MAG: hypothetical protein HYT31_02095 [Parcubacteria group bacterium]|nr:hypothetical protein [Parcubacteria group bacterium]